MDKLIMTEAFVTLASTDAYALGAMVLGHSLRIVNTSKQLAILVTRTVSQPMRNLLSSVFDHLEEVDVLDSRDTLNLGLLSRPDLGVTFTKLHCWRLTQYSKAVFMDADTMVIQNVDDLFEREELSASPDPGWPDCFNSGVFVFRPDVETYSRILQMAISHGSFDGGDQGLLNMFFNDWSTKDIKRHLPFTYNCVSQTFYTYLPAVTHFRSSIRVVHFIGPVKPWHHEVNENTRQVIPQAGTGFYVDFLQRWWDLYMEHVQLALSGDMAKFASSLAGTSFSAGTASGGVVGRSHEHSGQHEGAAKGGEPVGDRARQYAWERGDIDYTGSDRFDKILNKINTSLVKEEKPAKPETKSSPSEKEPKKK